MTTKISGPHQGQPVLRGGMAPDKAAAAMILIHGRGASAENILTLAAELQQPHFAYLAPQAAGNTWYPYSFMAPMAQNQPGLDSGLRVIADLLADLQENGFPPERVMLLGFSQGACLMSEYLARNARRYGGMCALSGGLIGPPGTPRNYPGSLEGTPAFFGCSDIDPHIPKERVAESAEVFKSMQGEVDLRLYSGMGHTINRDEVLVVQAMMSELISI